MKERLKSLRKALGMNQFDFAKGLDMAQNSYSQIETGQICLTDKNITLICLKYGVNEGWLRTGAGAMFIEKDLADTQEEKELLSLFRRLSAEMREFFLDMGRKLVKAAEKEAKKQSETPEDEGEAAQNVPGGATRPLEAPQEGEKGESLGIGPSQEKDGDTG